MRAILIVATALIGSILSDQVAARPVLSHVKLIPRRISGINNPRLEEVITNSENTSPFMQQQWPMLC